MIRKPYLRLALVLAIAELTAASTSAMAERARDRLREVMPHHYAPEISADRRISLAEAIATVQQQTGGRVLDARDMGDRYRLKVLRDGEVRIILVDPHSGRIHQR